MLTILPYTTETFGWRAAIRGMRNSYDSHVKSDSTNLYTDEVGGFRMGEEDRALALRLCKAGSSHAKFRRMIHVQADIRAPRYWWTEFDTYHWHTRNSESTMHTLLKDDLSTSNFSVEAFAAHPRLWKAFTLFLRVLKSVIKTQKDATDGTILGGGLLSAIKALLFEGFMQKSTIDTNYEELANIYAQRRNHRLPEWQTFCNWIEQLPHSEMITGKKPPYHKNHYNKAR